MKSVKATNAYGVKVGSWENTPNGGDPNYICETLYRTKGHSQFFLIAEGGPNTKYALTAGGWKGYGQKTVPLTIVEAKTWVRLHLRSSDYKAIFLRKKSSY